MDIFDAYYTDQFGYYPYEDESYLEQTRNTVSYLIDCGVTEKELNSIFKEVYPAPAITPDLIPDWLWQDSLIKKNTFYYHNSLQLRSKPVVVKSDGTVVTPKFSLEMRIRFTLDDLLNYYYNKTRYSHLLRDKKKDTGALKHLVETYDRLDLINGLDFVLALIDYACRAETDLEYNDIFYINNKYRSVVIAELEQHVKIAKAIKQDVIVWR